MAWSMLLYSHNFHFHLLSAQELADHLQHSFECVACAFTDAEFLVSVVID